LKIKSKLKITMLISILAVVFCLGMLADTFMRVREASTLEKRASEIVRGVFELTMLTNDYLIHKSNRAEHQWQIKHRQVKKLIRQSKTGAIDHARLFEVMFQDHETIQTLFSKLLDISATPEKKQNHIYEQLWDRLIGQITTTAQKIVSVAFRISAMAESELLSAQKRGGMIILSLMVTLVAIIAINSLFLSRSIAKPIISLQRDIEKIGRGDLDHVVPSDSNDEIGELAAAFNSMTSNLKKVMASKETLEAEISKRKHVEKQLRAARDELEVRVQERTAELVESQQMLEKVTMGITDAIMLIDTDYNIIWSNQYTASMFVQDSRNIVGNKCYVVTHNMDAPCFDAAIDCPIKKVQQTGQPASVIHRHVDQNEKDRFIEVLTYPVGAKEGKTTQYVHVSRDITERKLLQESIKASDERYRSLFNDALDMIHIVDDDGRIIDANPAEITILGYTKEEFIGKHLCDITHPDYKDRTRSYFQKVLDGENLDIYETALLTKTGETIHVEVNAVPKRLGSQGIRAVLRNITERKRLEHQLLQAQKMEAIGTLAGGVAHDFNNMLGVILGHTEMILEDMEPEGSHYENLEEVLKAAQRSADLTRQLLAFARKQTIEPMVLDLNDTVDGMLKMLKRLIGEDIELIWRPETNILPVKMDPAQLDQILANLCVNARDAIPDVGKVTIETENMFLDKAYCSDHFGFKPGKYVMLVVSDNGCGMDKQTVDKIFEPFFTTKESGKGSGLGLSTVYGIVKQNGGFINVYSEPGQGTSFKIFIRVHEGDVAEKIGMTAVDRPLGEGETILLVEDEQGLLTMGQRMLERLKYDVITATSPGEAMALAQKNANKIHLLITDVVMPKMSGKDLAGRIKGFNPNIKVLFMSGYTANVIAHHGVLDQGVHFIAKPFSIRSLSTKVREVLDQR
jgi:PAS domain S-box-containing protein